MLEIYWALSLKSLNFSFYLLLFPFANYFQCFDFIRKFCVTLDCCNGFPLKFCAGNWRAGDQNLRHCACSRIWPRCGTAEKWVHTLGCFGATHSRTQCLRSRQACAVRSEDSRYENWRYGENIAHRVHVSLTSTRLRAKNSLLLQR